MDVDTDRELCALISGLDLDQFSHLVEDGRCMEVIFQHIADCSDPDCLRIYREYEEAIRQLARERVARLSEAERWRWDLMRRQTLYILRRRRVII